MPFPQPDGTTKTGYGLVAALSYDDGATWPVRRLVTPVLAGGKPIHVQGTDGGKRLLDATTPNSMATWQAARARTGGFT